MRQLKDYSKDEWFRNKPLDHFLIDLCNDALLYGFRAWKPRILERFLEETERLKGQDVGLVIAYEQPWTLDWLIRMARRFVRGTLLVLDNSRRKDARIEIERVCRDAEVPYLGLPPSPTRHPNRSHGMAMTYAFYNVVRPLRVRTFTFIDHDLIPMEKTELGTALSGDQPFYGLPNESKWAWSLWAGYCSYDFARVGHIPLNFLNDFSNGLDTGGRNWARLYKNYEFSRVRFGSWRQARIADPFLGRDHLVDVVDENWIHLCGASYSDKFKETLDFYQRLAKVADEGATLNTLAV